MGMVAKSPLEVLRGIIMNRKNFLKVLGVGFVLSATGSLLKKCQKRVNNLLDTDDDYSIIFKDPPPPPKPEPKPEVKPKPVIKATETYHPDDAVNRYNPRWNVMGSWSAANNRKSLINHLAGPNHRHSKQSLIQMSTDDLQRLHDSDHGSGRTSSRRRGWFFR